MNSYRFVEFILPIVGKIILPIKESVYFAKQSEKIDGYTPVIL